MRKKSPASATLIVDMGYYDDDETLDLDLVKADLNENLSSDSQVLPVFVKEDVDKAIKEFADGNDGDAAYAIVIEVKRIIRYRNREVETKLVTEEVKLV